MLFDLFDTNNLDLSLTNTFFVIVGVLADFLTSRFMVVTLYISYLIL